MNIKKPHQLKSVIGNKLVFYILLASTLITTVFTGFSFYIDYRNKMSDINKMYTQVNNSFLTSLSEAVLNNDPPQINSQLNGILEFQDLYHFSTVKNIPILMNTNSIGTVVPHTTKMFNMRD